MATVSDPLDHIRQDPELLEDFVSLLVLCLSSEQKAGLARRKLQTGWLYCVCPADERAMIHRRTMRPIVKAPRPSNVAP